MADDGQGLEGTGIEGAKQYPCKSCGARLQYSPGASALKCPHCGTESRIPQSAAEIVELDFHAWVQASVSDAMTKEQKALKCGACGAETVLEGHETAKRCMFCDSPLVAEPLIQRHIRPSSVLPFKVTRDQAVQEFQKWVTSRWFAPSDLQATARAAAVDGVYMPFWTYDTNTQSWYTGERGVDYWETETYTTTENGESVTKTRQVRKTRWYTVSGLVWDNFDDVLVCATTSLPDKLVGSLAPWDLKALAPYSDDFLAGYKAESYRVDLADGFEKAKDIMAVTIRGTINHDIGGDHQRIHSVRTQYDDITFKHVLLPLWISAYRYNDKVWRFLVNARTGEVQGERPYSAVKIAAFVIALLSIIGTILYFSQH